MKKIDKNVICPFCGAEIKGKIPEGLNIKKIIELINKINEENTITQGKCPAKEELAQKKTQCQAET